MKLHQESESSTKLWGSEFYRVVQYSSAIVANIMWYKYYMIQVILCSLKLVEQLH